MTDSDRIGLLNGRVKDLEDAQRGLTVRADAMDARLQFVEQFAGLSVGLAAAGAQEGDHPAEDSHRQFLARVRERPFSPPRQA